MTIISELLNSVPILSMYEDMVMVSASYFPYAVHIDGRVLFLLKKLSYIGLFAGLVLMVLLLAWHGLGDVMGLLLAMGWSLLLVTVVWLPTLYISPISWRLLFLPGRSPPFTLTVLALWIGRAINTLLPVASIGGELIKARILSLRGVDTKDASASVLVDKTVQVITMILWGLTGVCLLFIQALDNQLALAALVGFSILGAGVAGFIVVQRVGMFKILTKSARKISRSDYWASLIDSASTADKTVSKLYQLRGRFFLSCVWRYFSLVLQTGEVWVAAWLLGYPLSIMEAIMLKSLCSTLVDVAFLIPNGYGIQEGAYLVVGTLIGLPADVCLTISLATRVRELLVDVPGLLMWQHIEGQRLFGRMSQSESA